MFHYQNIIKSWHLLINIHVKITRCFVKHLTRSPWVSMSRSQGDNDDVILRYLTQWLPNMDTVSCLYQNLLARLMFVNRHTDWLMASDSQSRWRKIVGFNIVRHCVSHSYPKVSISMCGFANGENTILYFCCNHICSFFPLQYELFELFSLLCFRTWKTNGL